jgi:hypothetical protein
MDKRMDNSSTIADVIPADHLHTVGSEPLRNVGRVEANEVTDLDEGDPPLGDESSKMPLGGAERSSDLVDPKEFG